MIATASDMGLSSGSKHLDEVAIGHPGQCGIRSWLAFNLLGHKESVQYIFKRNKAREIVDLFFYTCVWIQ